MKKSIFLLFLLLISCAPVAAVPPTVTPSPPSPTITPTPLPTDTPSPTPTPEGFQTSPDGAVQVFENGKWVDIPLPNTIWGDKPEGASIVLKENEAVLQMELNNFQTPDGSNVADIAEYNKETKKWEVKPFSVTRISLNDLPGSYYDKNYNIDRLSAGGGSKVEVLTVGTPILGIRVEENDAGNSSLKIMTLYKGEVGVLMPNEIKVISSEPASSTFEVKKVSVNNLKVEDLMEIVRITTKNTINQVDPNINGFANMYFFTPRSGVDSIEECLVDPAAGWRLGTSFNEWCAKTVENKNRKIITEIDIARALKGEPGPFVIDEDFDLSSLNDLWAAFDEVYLESAYLQFEFVEQK
jgi:hypothetical protein